MGDKVVGERYAADKFERVQLGLLGLRSIQAHPEHDLFLKFLIQK